MTKILYKIVNGKKVRLTDDEVSEYHSNQPTNEEILENQKNAKISQLNFYYDSEITKKTAINIKGDQYEVINDQKLRNLLLSKIDILEKKISKNLIEEKNAIFSFVINKTRSIDLNIEELREILFFLDESRQSKFEELQNHQKNIMDLSVAEEIEKYKFE